MVRGSLGLHDCLGLKLNWLGLRPSWLGLRPGWLGLRPGWMAQRGDERTCILTENLPTLQDFIAYWGPIVTQVYLRTDVKCLPLSAKDALVNVS